MFSNPAPGVLGTEFGFLLTTNRYQKVKMAPSSTWAIWKDKLSCEGEQKRQCVVQLTPDIEKNAFLAKSTHSNTLKQLNHKSVASSVR